MIKSIGGAVNFTQTRLSKYGFLVQFFYADNVVMAYKKEWH